MLWVCTFVQAISVWSNNSAVPSANANTFSSDESGSSGSSDGDSSGEEETPPLHGGASSSSGFGPRSVYRNSLRLSRKWVRKGTSGDHPPGRPPRPTNFVALATSPCGCMFAAACKGSEDVTVWLRRRNMTSSPPPPQRKSWETHGSGGGVGARGGGAGIVSIPGSAARRGGRGGKEEEKGGEGPWNFQPATVLNSSGPLVQVVWGRGPGAQQDYLLTLGEDGRCAVRWKYRCFLFFVSLPPLPTVSEKRPGPFVFVIFSIFGWKFVQFIFVWHETLLLLWWCGWSCNLWKLYVMPTSPAMRTNEHGET